FAWPLPYGGGRSEHIVRFEKPEPSQLRRVTPYGTIDPQPKDSPLDGDTLKLANGLFADDALVWERIDSRQLIYGVPGFPSLRIDFPDTPSLGIWTKPNARFLCIEPWAGIADPNDYQGEFAQKPAVMFLQPDEEYTFRMNIALDSF
ncbi:MAG TPA: aldose 1-epimerase family protein, partial [Sphingorhabdus sp.]|nr:aldose 1-epimerase family protein [Sphingorhabdus sp.]